ncbi:hypothetical protein MSG28_012219 [Choristoneura fumiferana]|uniref:Uncharacterized protein n=1 Tax=Choristoneura fumiferana TaxID=7141 RepID=A0ACC0KCY3_CHOFU|nr:hypothetical protein MSG28_012219 [Choristoneura fumiferana]
MFKILKRVVLSPAFRVVINMSFALLHQRRANASKMSWASTRTDTSLWLTRWTLPSPSLPDTKLPHSILYSRTSYPLPLALSVGERGSCCCRHIHTPLRSRAAKQVNIDYPETHLSAVKPYNWRQMTSFRTKMADAGRRRGPGARMLAYPRLQSIVQDTTACVKVSVSSSVLPGAITMKILAPPDGPVISPVESFHIDCGLEFTNSNQHSAREEIRHRTKVIVTHRISKLKWQWASHISRRTDNPSRTRPLEWRPRIGKSKNWMSLAEDRAQWRANGEAYVQQWTKIGR